MKKMLVLLLAVMIFFASAFAQTLPRAQISTDLKKLKLYADWTQNDDGTFAARSQAAAIVKEAFQSRIGTYGSGGLLAFYAELEGNVNTMVFSPVLRILYAGTGASGIRAVSFAFDGTRYDFAVSGTGSYHGRVRVETLSVLLDEEGCAFLQTLSKATQVNVGLWGNGQYTTAIERGAAHMNPRQELATESLKAVLLPDGAGTPAADAFAQQKWNQYHADADNAVYMETTKIAVSDTADAAFGLLIEGASVTAIRQAQETLIDAGYMFGTAGANVTDDMISAVLRAQRHYGRLQTGYADPALIRAIERKDEIVLSEKKTVQPTYTCTADEARFTLNRWWTANAVSTQMSDALRERTDADNVLVIADGEIQGLRERALALTWETEATLLYNDKYAFPANMYCETNGSTAFSGTLNMLARSRLVVTAEVPAYLMDEAGSWKLRITVGANQFEFTLE